MTTTTDEIEELPVVHGCLVTYAMRRFRSGCVCGWTGTDHTTSGSATIEWAGHLAKGATA